jgi:hypothetical protein
MAKKNNKKETLAGLKICDKKNCIYYDEKLIYKCSAIFEGFSLQKCIYTKNKKVKNE